MALSPLAGPRDRVLQSLAVKFLLVPGELVWGPLLKKAVFHNEADTGPVISFFPWAFTGLSTKIWYRIEFRKS
jgi:hypothetical protein